MRSGGRCFVVVLMAMSILAVALTPSFAVPLNILVADGGLDIGPRLTGLGHTVTQSDASTWGSGFDYSPFDVVAFQYGVSDPGDIAHFVSAVDGGIVGAVFFRGYGAETTAQQLGLITGNNLWWQTPTDLNILDNTHFITSTQPLGVVNLGYTYMALVQSPAAAWTTTLATGPSGAALVVHDIRRAAITPYYGHFDGHDSETAVGIEITERTLQWAAGAQLDPDIIPEPATLTLLALGGLGLLARRRKKR